MRPAQQNRRMRGRGNNNRKGPNPLSRNYESNGPDVKIRGNAQHIAEKYTTLARDAQASGDRVMAENYLQHAEHYNRIIMAAQANAPVPFQRDESFDDDMDDEDEGFEQQQPAAAAPAPAPKPVNGSGPQPVIEGTPAEVVFGEDGPEVQKQPTDRRGPSRQRRPRPERPERTERSVEPERAPVEAKAKAEAEQPVVNGEAAHAVNGTANGAAEEAAPVETRRPRRAPRPRRTAATEANGDGESPKAEAFSEAGSDA
ncbi:hypothetical protein GCM10011491_19950 [Brucella endophytica]|uniref:DUF4167 domain-containing protein n=1 Tax=Brucella endophytica TaxID=1963359 RepID=A0A916WF61_9HYPH|nr:DUF4167 domain-containing protein [Brucella endophytica]GGA91947.1 hypothetical protein GCM10011491_19950 [Brucella endophytica]